MRQKLHRLPVDEPGGASPGADEVTRRVRRRQVSSSDLHATREEPPKGWARVGYRSLRYDGMRKVLLGLTTIEEIEQNTSFEWAS